MRIHTREFTPDGAALQGRRDVLRTGAASVAASLVSSLFGALAVTLHAQGMDVTRNGSRPTVRGAAEMFTGHVVVDPLFGRQQTPEPRAARSRFHPAPARRGTATTMSLLV
jgi:hypothetical protein